MRFLEKVKDGGPQSPVDGYVLIEIKSLFSIMLLKFHKGGREAFHTHAFNALTWFIKGDMVEKDIDGSEHIYSKSFLPKLTKRDKCHRVIAHRDSWCFTLRGPWVDTWLEYRKGNKVTLTHGRKEI